MTTRVQLKKNAGRESQRAWHQEELIGISLGCIVSDGTMISE
jgi:hypothetical protein